MQRVRRDSECQRDESDWYAMRLVTWNANMALHRKLPLLVEKLNPDIAIIPECAAEDILRHKGGLLLPPFSMVWVGRDQNKGLGVFAFGDYTVALAESYDSRLEWIAPIAVQGPTPFRLLAVWASNHRAELQHPEHPSIPQPAAALSVYRDWVSGRSVVLAGDFNHNVRWDGPRSVRNHANTVQACADAGLMSAYHEWFSEAQGAETIPTHYWRNRTEDGPSYHIDYIFIPNAWRPRLRNVEVGSFSEWVGAGLSDHVPVVVDLAMT